MCHLFFLIPLAGIPLFWLMPLESALTINIFLWLVCGVLVYKVLNAMKAPPRDDFKSLMGTQAIVVSTVNPHRYLVKAAGELWTARSAEALQPGDKITISALEGIKLVVERVM